MIELEISAITARSHARQLGWLLDQCREDDVSKDAIDDIQHTIMQAEHLADLQDPHAEEDGCPRCVVRVNGPRRRRSLVDHLPSRKWLRFEAAWQLLHIADESLLAVAPDCMFVARAPEIAVQARRWLGPDDPRLAPITNLLRPGQEPATEVTRVQRYALAGILHAIHCTWDRGYARARSFRHLVVVATVLLTIGVAALVAVGVLWPHALPLCTSGTLRVCATGSADPQPGDVALVALVGAIAAGFSAVAGIARLRPLVDPYRTPIVQGLLKVPTGAFTAMLGVLAVEQGLQAGAGLPASQGGMLFLAFLFGYSQQIVTRFVDSYGSQIRAGLAGQRTRGGEPHDVPSPPL